MDLSLMAESILSHVGGKENVTRNMICVSRLRLDLKDQSKVDLDAIKAMEGVLGIIEAKNLQIVLGTTNVKRVGREFSVLTGLPLETVEVVCGPGEPCGYACSTGKNEESFLDKMKGLFKKKK